MKRSTSKYPDAPFANALWRAVKVADSDPARFDLWRRICAMAQERGPSFSMGGGGPTFPPPRDPDERRRQRAVDAVIYIGNSGVQMGTMDDNYRQRLAACAWFFERSPGTDWQDVQRRLLEIARRGEPYTSLRDLAARLKCAIATVKKALDRSPKLRQWRDRKASGAPKAQSLSDVVTDNTASAAPRPADMLPDPDVNDRMKMLIAQAMPSVRPQLVAMNKDQRREYVRDLQEQGQDLLNEDYAPKGNRILGRKP